MVDVLTSQMTTAFTEVVPTCSQACITPARVGRQNQRYSPDGLRMVAGCVPYRLRDGHLEVLLITNRKKTHWIIPKGGWEEDETAEMAAVRETYEEAGVRGTLGPKLVEFVHEGKDHQQLHSYFALHVTDTLGDWPEGGQRDRAWFPWPNAAEVCRRQGMSDAIAALHAALETQL